MQCHCCELISHGYWLLQLDRCLNLTLHVVDRSLFVWTHFILVEGSLHRTDRVLDSAELTDDVAIRLSSGKRLIEILDLWHRRGLDQSLLLES